MGILVTKRPKESTAFYSVQDSNEVLQLLHGLVEWRKKLTSPPPIAKEAGASTPAMEVKARAPGKVILTGDHAVVHGAAAVAASIELYTYASFRPAADEASPGDGGEGRVVINLKDMELVFSWPLEILKEKLPTLGHLVPSSPCPCSPETMTCISSLVEEQDIPKAKAGLVGGLSAFLYLYRSIRGLKPGEVVVTSELPLGSGLGSSAAFCVSIVDSLLATSSVVSLNLQHNDWIRFPDQDLELVNRWAFEGEKIIHGKPSGIDYTVSTFGHMIMFKMGELSRIESTTPIRMLITNTKIGRNTKALVAGVSERVKWHPDAMGAVFTSVDFISSKLSSLIQQDAFDDVAITEKEERLGELMEMSEGLLQCMGVSHPSIETVLQTTLKYKLSSKLTGAGGGGCILTLLPKLLSSLVVDEVILALHSCGFECFVAEVGGKDMEVLFSSSS